MYGFQPHAAGRPTGASALYRSARPPAGADGTSGAGAAPGGRGDVTGAQASASSVLHNALYGARANSSSAGTALYRSFDVAPKDKSILAAAVDDALMSPTPPHDPMLLETAASAGGVAADALADFTHGAGGHRLKMGVVQLGVLAAAAGIQAAGAYGSGVAGQQAVPSTVLYGQYQARGGSSITSIQDASGRPVSTALYGNKAQGASSLSAAGLTGDVTVAHLKRLTAAQLKHLQVVRQQQAAAASAAAVADAAAPSAAASSQAAAPMDVSDAPSSTSETGAASAYKRQATAYAAAGSSASAAAVPSALYKRQALSAAAQQPAAAAAPQESWQPARPHVVVASPPKHTLAHTGIDESPCDSAETTYLDCQEELCLDMVTDSSCCSTYGRPSHRVYGPLYMPTIYSDASSPAALDLANDVMAKLVLPGNTHFMPVPVNSVVFTAGVAYGFSAFAVSLGSSYFQRLVDTIPQLNMAVRALPRFAPYVTYMRTGSEAAASAMTPEQQQQQECTVQSVQFTCVYLATKIVDRMPCLELLRYILTRLYGAVVSQQQAADVEAKCLEGLRYRLGPFHREDDLAGEPACCEVW